MDHPVLASSFPVFIAAFTMWQQRRNTLAAARAVGAPGLAAAAFSALATIMYINAFRRTSVADVMIERDDPRSYVHMERALEEYNRFYAHPFSWSFSRHAMH